MGTTQGRVKMSKGKQDKNSGEAKEPVKVYKWDGTAVKNALDDAVKEVMTGKLPYTENFNLMDGVDHLRGGCGCRHVCSSLGFPQPIPKVKACSDWMCGLLLYPHGHSDPVHHFQGKGDFCCGHAERPSWLGSRLQIGSSFKHEEPVVLKLHNSLSSGKKDK